MTRRAWLAAAGLGAVLACAEWAGPELGGPRLAVVPVFGAGAGTVLLNDLDQLRVVVTGSGGARAGVVVADTTVPVDAAGNATLTVPVLLLGGTAQLYDVQLQGIRSSDGSVLYSGFDTVTVQAGHATRVDSVPVSYLGPCQIGPCVVTLAPQNVTLKQAGSLVMVVSVDSLGVVPVPNVPVRLINVTPGLIGLASDLTVTALSGTSCGGARIAASIPGATDTLRLGVDAPVTIPAVLFAGDSSGGLSSGVFCQNTNGTGRFPVSVNGASGDVNPRYSPDRQRVAYTFNPAGQQQLWVARWAGDSEAVVDTGAYRPRWSPDGLHLAYECGSGFPTNVCVIQDATGPIPLLAQAPRRIFSDVVPTRLRGSGSFAWDPRSPDRLAFTLDSLTADLVPKTTSALYVAKFDGTGIVSLTVKPIDFGSGVLQISELDWSPRGDVIVFSATDTLPSSPSKLYAINRDGTGLRRLTTGSDYDSRPVVSPDGAQVLFLRSSGGSMDYWRIRVDGTGEQQVTSEGFGDITTTSLGHDWSPNGKEIVLVGSGPDGQYVQLLVYTVPGTTTAATYMSDRVLVARGAGAGVLVSDGQPSWRP